MKNIYLFMLIIATFSVKIYAQDNALNFDGTNDYVQLSSSINLANSSYTLECWFKTTNATQTGYFMVIGSSSGGTRLSTGIKLNPFQAGDPEVPANIQYWMYGDDHFYNWISDNDWHHVAFTFNSSTNLGKLYLDGIFIESSSFGGNMTGSGSALLSASTWAIDGFFNGTIDEVRIWNIERSATDISNNYQNLSLNPATAGLLAYYHFDQGVGGTNNTGVTTLTDASSNNYNGTLNNFALSGETSNWVITNNSVLPVELTTFTANVNENEVTLNWQTATEVNNYGFEIERQTVETLRATSNEWETIGFVEGHGNSNSPKDYTFTDDLLNLSLNLNLNYRLKQIDFDGNCEYSDEITVDLAENVKAYKLEQNYPNPFNPSTTIKYSIPVNVKSEMSNVKLIVYDILGNEVATLVNERQKSGNYEVKFDASNLSSGIYLYKLQSGSFVQTRKLMLVK